MNISYSTSRLRVYELQEVDVASKVNRIGLSIVELLTPSVVQSLPPYFHGIDTSTKAESWLTKMLAESRLCVVESKNADDVVGFIFAYDDGSGDVNIGYLLGEQYWGIGLAGEMLSGFIEIASHVSSDNSSNGSDWNVLIGGVDNDNIASIKLLTKLGFRPRSSQGSEVASGVSYFALTL
ncbi:GNAT family N-acetyltransferase [Marinomonas mediterranea]|uniref:Ferrichrome-binding protein n=1 Tax=Marinomonas mediterranea (strain ATCC 700492 / JCM 21426 / NBRC 103028 / MMB-1) TaxID=717774 RepID=F2JZ24_MARM1|nr:GNAT family N-acetyltransferase [Marinomonas mediterranea]ADZ92002.1 ferrichrome-binding protein [Marinomonas mediterranea MMB-1]WCN14028.1 GNAT family N-acetyltransferase [Marinomonas mediterranea]WCN18079.1 GNAT family N-acetyltransferase [Marinomonas mediterranea MMB-1]